jgi:hypothetical protein
MIRPVLYLDFDGVLNDNEWLRCSERWDRIRGLRAASDYEAMCELAPTQDLRPHLAARVRRIVDATGARVVVCSSWRRDMTDDQLRDALARVGLPFDGSTPRQVHKMSVHDGRERDILAHVATLENGARWCVLDDDVEDWPGTPFAGRAVQPVDGVTEEDADRVIAILRGEP